MVPLSLEARAAPPRRTALLELAELVLRREERPMRLHEINAAVSALLERELGPNSMKQALSANLKSGRPRFRRLSWGLYDLGREPAGILTGSSNADLEGITPS
jgi:hypothetical protein